MMKVLRLLFAFSLASCVAPEGEKSPAEITGDSSNEVVEHYEPEQIPVLAMYGGYPSDIDRFEMMVRLFNEGLIVTNPDGSYQAPARLVPNLDAAAAYLKDQLASRRAGWRYLHFSHVEGNLGSQWIQPNLPEDRLFAHDLDRCVDPQSGAKTNHPCPWFEHGIAWTREKIRALFSRLKAVGAEVDGIHMYNEYHMSTWAMSVEQIQAIQNDPRFATQLAPLLWNPIGDLRQIYYWWCSAPNGSNCPAGDPNGIARRNHFNAIINSVVNKHFKEGIYDPIREYYPKAQMSDYNKIEVHPLVTMYDYNGHLLNLPGDGRYYLPALSHDLSYMNLGGFSANPPEGVGAFENTAFHRILFSINQARALRMSATANGQKFHPVIAEKNYWADTLGDYYNEAIMHYALTNPDVVIFWNASNSAHRAADNRLVADIFKEFDSLAGYSNRRSLVKNATPWQSDYISTSIRAGRNLVTRLTLDLPPNESISSRLVPKGSDLEVVVGSKKLLYRKAKVQMSPLSTRLGAWIIQERVATTSPSDEPDSIATPTEVTTTNSAN